MTREVRFWWRSAGRTHFGGWLDVSPWRDQLLEKVKRFPSGDAGVEYR